MPPSSASQPKMNPKATQLDQMLYAWLAETDDRKFDQAFQRYYEGASPSLVRYLVRCSSLADLDCEQIAVDALLKFFCRAGRDRRQAAAAVTNVLPQIQPLNLGPFHVRQVQRWRGEVDSFRHTSMTFRLAPQDGAERPWKAEIQAQIDGIPPLQRQGLHLLESARVACAAVADLADGTPEKRDADGTSEAPSAEYTAMRAFAVYLCAAAEKGAVGISAAESRHPGVVKCVDAAWTVVEVLPALRIPTNGYLFDIAHSLYLDECKARGRKKRGGGGVSPGESDAGGAARALAPFDLDEQGALHHEEDNDPAGGTPGAFAVRPGELTSDPTAELIDEDFCEQFYAYLSKPLDDAQEAYRRAAAAGKGEAERKRLVSISEKHARFMAVLAMRIEGQTQEAIAESLGLSRNQVKYIAEQAQAAYQQFCAAAMRSQRS
jgi:DNA-directed RNA polymerase specialized sigma24 family protein